MLLLWSLSTLTTAETSRMVELQELLLGGSTRFGLIYWIEVVKVATWFDLWLHVSSTSLFREKET